MSDKHPTLIYLDTNVYSRPFDDQTQPAIQAEANAFMEIVSEVKAKRLALLCSDILTFEIHNILSEAKRAKLEKATRFILLVERGQGDSVQEIIDYWGDTGIEQIHQRVLAWKSKQPSSTGSNERSAGV